MKSTSPQSSALAVSLLALLSALPLRAQTERVWSGATSANFGTTSNWSGSIAPGTTTNVTTSTNTDIAVFDGAARAGDISLGGSRNLGGFKFTGANVAAYNVGTGGTFRFNLTLGGEVSLDADVAAAQSIQRLGLTGATGTYTFRNDAAGAATTLTAASTLLNYTNGAATLILAGANTGANAVIGVISENSGAGALALAKNGAGAWVLQGANTFAGGVTLNDGTLALRNNAALGTGTLTLAGGRIGSVVVTRTLANAVSITGDVQLGGAAADTGLTATTTVFGGAVNLNGAARTLTLANSATFSGVVSNGGLIVAATAPELGLTLGADNAFAGGTTILGGRVIATNAGALGDGDLTINGGELRIFGDATEAVNLGAGADFAMSSGFWTVQLGTTFDQLVGAGGSFALTGGTINLDVTGTGFAYDQTYAILNGFSGGIVSGLVFTGYDTLVYQAVLSDAGVLSFAAIPEPSMFGALAAWFAMGAAGMRRKSRRVA